MSRPILILVGTMSGAAELTAEELVFALKRAGRDARALRMEKAGLDLFSPERALIVCTSTYGKGEVPDNARPLFAALERERPDLTGVRYGVVALGDHTHFGTVCFGGIKFDELLAGLGAERIGARVEHDGSTGEMPEDAALAWLPGWLAALDAAE